MPRLAGADVVFNSLGPIADISVVCLHKLMGIYMGDLTLGDIH